ncbi:MAG TPA: glutathione transferase GstA [Alphaproteobacteria bacterium]|nr:glutathione transferase GstA [Alphaproteobacteria bacterium]
MKLYFAPGTCSLSPHIALAECGLAFETERVDLRTKVTQSGADYRAINPKGSVPALQLDNGEVLTEGPAIVQYIADQKPEAKLAPPAGTLERYRLQEWLNFISSELHKAFAPLFTPGTPEETKTSAVAGIRAKLDHIAKTLENRLFLMGEEFTVADGYLYTILGWTKFGGIDIGDWVAIKAYHDRIAARPAVQAAQAAEKAA